jgi:hypothetical protein
VAYGAVAGGFLGLIAVALLGGRFALNAAVATPVADGSPRASIEFVASSGGMYMLVLLAGIVGGLAIAGITYAVGRESEPDAPKFPLRWLLPTAGFVSGVAAYATFRAGLGLFADITAGVVTISVSQLVLIALSSGAVAGAVTAFIVDRLARPESLGLGGVAWPSGARELLGAMTRAVGLPIMAVVIGGVFALGLSQLLLGVSATTAVVIFSVVGVLVLGGAVLLAYRPWERDRDVSAS